MKTKKAPTISYRRQTAVWATVLLLLSMLSTSVSSCSGDDDSQTTQASGRKITLSATVEAVVKPASRTSYADDVENRILTVDWEAQEAITVISIGESGISAIDEFTSTGEAGRTVAEFTGTYTGKEGDTVICLYPALSTTAGAARFSGVAVGATQIELNYPAHAPSRSVASLKEWDVMVGTVELNGSAASVRLKRQMSVLKLGVSGTYPYDSSWRIGKYLLNLGVSASDNAGSAKALASHGTMSTRKSTFDQTFTPDQYYASNYFTLSPQQTEDVEIFYYIPVFGNGTLNGGDLLRVSGRINERDDGPWYQYDKTVEFTIPNGQTIDFSYGQVIVAHVNM